MDDDYRSTKGNHNERESLTSMRSNKKISYRKKNFPFENSGDFLY